MTIFDLINSLKKISTLQPNIRSCGEGNIYDFYNANPSIEYGTFFITQGQHKSTEMFDEYQLTLFYVDRLADDYSNKIEIQSTGKEALENIIGLFVEEFDAECGEVQYQPFTERFADLTAGVYANVTLGMERTTVCAEDFNGLHAGAHIFEINNQSKKEEFTKNGDYVVTYDKGVGYTGLEEVRIKVNLPFEEKTIQISENGQTTVVPSEDFEGMDKVVINTDVSGKIDPRQIVDIYEDGVTEVDPNEGQYGIAGATITVNTQGKIDPRKVIEINEDGVTEVDPQEGQYGIKGATITVDTQGKIDPVRTIEIKENGTTEVFPNEGQYGIAGVTINTDVSGKIDPVREETYIKNGTYQINPEAGQYGIAGAVIDVALPMEERTIDITEDGQTTVVPSTDIEGITKVVINTNTQGKIDPIKEVEINENGVTDVLPSDGQYGIKGAKITVDVSGKIDPRQNLSVSKNGTYQIDHKEGQYGIEGATVDVALPLEERTVEISENGQTVITPNQDIEGITKVTINTDVSSKIDPVREEKYTENGIYEINPSEGQYGIKGAEINVNVHPILQNKTVVENGIVNADEGWDGLNEVNVQVPIPTFKTEEKTITITSNGKQTVTPSSDFDGLSKVDIDVNVEGKKFTTEEKTVSITKNGQTIIEKSTDKDGMTKVIANVDVPQAKLEENKAIRVIENGTTIVSPSLGFDGLKQAEITVDIPSKQPVTEPLKVIENGIYTPSAGIDGYNRVEVNVPTGTTCNLGTLTATENKTYTPTDLDGWNSVEVNVPFPALEDKKTIQISENGKKLIYPSDGFEGMKLTEVDVNIPLEDKQVTISENGTKTYYPSKNGGFKKFVVNTQITGTTKYIQDNGVYNATDGMLWNSVEVNVQPRLQEKTVYKNGNVVPDTGYYGLSKVNVNVPQSKLEDTRTKTITENGLAIINPSFGFDAMKQTEVTVDVRPKLEEKSITITSNGKQTVTPELGYYGISKADIDINVQPKLEEKSITITSNGKQTVFPTNGFDGLKQAEININVRPKLEEKTRKITSNGKTIITPTYPNDGISRVEIDVNVQPILQTKTVYKNGEVVADPQYDGLSKVIVNVPASGGIDLTGTGWENEPIFPVDVWRIDNLQTYLNYTREKYAEWKPENTSAFMLYKNDKNLVYAPAIKTQNVVDMKHIYSGCERLFAVSALETQNVTSMSDAFYGCINLAYIPRICTSKVETFDFCFCNCEKIVEIPYLDTSSGVNFYYCFAGCKKLENLPLMIMSKADNLSFCFSGCGNLTNIGGFINLKSSLSLADNPKLTHQSLINVINNLGEADPAFEGGKPTLTLGSENFKKITEAEIAVAISKGWIVEEYGL